MVIIMQKQPLVTLLRVDAYMFCCFFNCQNKGCTISKTDTRISTKKVYFAHSLILTRAPVIFTPACPSIIHVISSPLLETGTEQIGGCRVWLETKKTIFFAYRKRITQCRNFAGLGIHVIIWAPALQAHRVLRNV